MQIVSEDAEDANNDVRADTPIGTATQQRLEPLARRSSISTKKTQEEERLMSDIASRGEQSTAFQAKVLEMLAPPKVTERTAYADWAKEVMVSLHPSLWLKFQRECSNMLYSYQEQSVAFLHPVVQQQRYPAQQQQQQQQQQHQHQQQLQQQQYQANYNTWQPPPQQWPASVQQGQSVWGSQDPAWVQSQVNPPTGQQLIPLQTMQRVTETRRSTPSGLSPTAASSTPIHDVETSFNLSSLVRDTVGLSDTSVDMVVMTPDV